jgi:hypothetical protein
MGISDIEFKQAWESRNVATLEGVKANIIGLKQLLRAKQGTRRKVDTLDKENLKKLRRHKKR